MRTIRVNASKAYDVLVGAGLLDRAGGLIKAAAGGDLAVVVTDDIVAGLYLDRLINALTDAGYKTCVFEVENGESSKNTQNYIKLLNFLAEHGVTRSDIVVALGGGVVGDLAGFAAATYMRGVPYVQIPTTLLAAVDSSVGGKTAIDLPVGKNLAGAFYQPEIVICDHDLLQTLSERVFADGMAEVIKYGMIADPELFRMTDLEEIITRCVTIKRDVVCEDEFETGVRKLLNFGHTVGHAVEKLSNYAISHGEAVAIGMAVETRAAVSEGFCDETCLNELIETLKRNQLSFESPYGTEELFIAAGSDKKRNGDTITLIFPQEIGKCVLRDVKVSDLKRLIACGTG
ncbi:MAG: 3-dehydroquinate synthase [Oscillospiraceae bacterium]|nr:3-dehydroquinate synthase [Oscillospiraceae bacterium]